MTFAYFDNIYPCVYLIHFFLEMASVCLEIIEIVACNKIEEVHILQPEPQSPPLYSKVQIF